jgi:hypothetical protein
MTRKELARILKRVGASIAARAAGRNRNTLRRYCKGQSHVPPDVAESLARLNAVPPMSPRELSAIVAHMGGFVQLAAALGINAQRVRAWRAGYYPVPYRFLAPLRALWSEPRGARAPRRFARSEHDGHTMSHDEFRELMESLGGVASAAHCLGCSNAGLRRYVQYPHPIPASLASALRLAHRMRGNSRDHRQIALRVHPILFGSKPLSKRKRRRARPPDQIAADIERLVTVLRSSGPLSEGQARVALRMVLTLTKVTIRVALRSGRIVRLKDGRQSYYGVPEVA